LLDRNSSVTGTQRLFLTPIPVGRNDTILQSGDDLPCSTHTHAHNARLISVLSPTPRAFYRRRQRQRSIDLRARGSKGTTYTRLPKEGRNLHFACLQLCGGASNLHLMGWGDCNQNARPPAAAAPCLDREGLRRARHHAGGRPPTSVGRSPVRGAALPGRSFFLPQAQNKLQMHRTNHISA
jgi:hypothetical protein